MELDLIPIAHKNELTRFGFDSDRFVQFSTRDKIGGKEWHGPCPRCGGQDRLIVSNGLYNCRTCGYKGNLSRITHEELSPEERALLEERRKKEDERLAKDREAKRARLNVGKVKMWQVFHNNLLRNAEMLQRITEEDGIPLPVIKQFGVGYHPKFQYKDDGKECHSPAITFPHFQMGSQECVNIRCRLLVDPLPQSGKYRPIMTNLGIAFLLAEHPGQDTCIYVEGEKKALVCYANGFSSVALWGVDTMKVEWINWWKRHWKYHVVIFDNDNDHVIESGNRLAYQLGGVSLNLQGKIDDLLNSKQLTPFQLKNVLDSTKGAW
jgi:hypothetical protein